MSMACCEGFSYRSRCTLVNPEFWLLLVRFHRVKFERASQGPRVAPENPRQILTRRGLTPKRVRDGVRTCSDHGTTLTPKI